MSRYHEDGMEMKQSYRPPAAAAASTTLAWSYKDYAMMHFFPDEGAGAPSALLMDRIAIRNFSELSFCRQARNGNVHSCIVEAIPLSNPSSYVRSCGVCPTRGVERDTSVELRIMGHPRNLKDLEGVRKTWADACARLDSDRIAAKNSTGHRDTDRVNMKANASLAIAERDTWMQYTLVTFDLVRASLIMHYAAVLKGAPGLFTGNNLTAYESYQSSYVTACTSRTSALSLPTSALKEEDMLSIPYMMCPIHKVIGHMFPVAKASSYRPECFICISLDAPRAPWDEMQSTPGFADGKSFLSHCGKISGAAIRASTDPDLANGK